jgi:hypothetical protein
MPWTIPNLLLHDKPVPLSNRRSHGQNRVFVCCSNPDDAELDVSGFPDHTTFNDMQPRIVCSIWDHRGADVSPSWLHHSQREFGGESHRVERTTKFMLAAVIGTTAPNLIGIVLLGFQSKLVSQLFNRRELLDFLELIKGIAVLLVRNNCH